MEAQELDGRENQRQSGQSRQARFPREAGARLIGIRREIVMSGRQETPNEKGDPSYDEQTGEGFAPQDGWPHQ